MADAMLVATDLCMQCNACTVECVRNNDLPVGQGVAWTRIREVETGTYPAVRRLFVKWACNHCTEASCLNVCPTGAISKPDGVHTVIDQAWCIGCGYCVQACPFGVPSFGQPKRSSQKCDFCYGTRASGEPTACAAACPYFALSFGDRQEMIDLGRQRVEQLQQKGLANATLYGEQELGGLQVLYVLEDRPAVYGLPEAPQVATQQVGGDWLSGLLAAGLLAIFPFWLLFKRKETLATGEAAETAARAAATREEGES
jgi:Fe-S-cluster-containing dehydrogenase component